MEDGGAYTAEPIAVPVGYDPFHAYSVYRPEPAHDEEEASASHPIPIVTAPNVDVDANAGAYAHAAAPPLPTRTDATLADAVGCVTDPKRLREDILWITAEATRQGMDPHDTVARAIAARATKEMRYIATEAGKTATILARARAKQKRKGATRPGPGLGPGPGPGP